MWHHWDRRWRGWGRPPWFPRDAVDDVVDDIADPTQVEGWEEAMQSIDNVQARVRYNPQEDAGNVPERDALARVVMDIPVPWEVAVAIEGAEAEGAAVAAGDRWRHADADDEEAAPWFGLAREYNVAGATEDEDHDSWTTEQSRDAAESLSSAGSFILEPSSRSGWRRAREGPREHQRWGRARDS